MRIIEGPLGGDSTKESATTDSSFISPNRISIRRLSLITHRCRTSIVIYDPRDDVDPLATWGVKGRVTYKNPGLDTSV